MKSYEVLKRVVESVGTKRVASDLGVSSSLVYKWCAEPTTEPGEDHSGARNPLDRLVSVIQSTGDREPIEWLCDQAGGFFAEITDVEGEAFDEEYIRNTREILSRFSELLQVLSDSITNESRVDPEEAAAIRKQWQKLAGRAEAFVRACEDGRFDPERGGST